MAQFQPPPNLSLQGNLAENWKSWSQRFELFSVASGVSEKSEKVQCATFLHVAGEEAIKVCNTFVFADAEINKIAVLKRKFKEYCEPRKNLTYIRHVFFTRAQKQSEPIDSYVTDLKNKAKDCEFGDLHDSLVCYHMGSKTEPDERDKQTDKSDIDILQRYLARCFPGLDPVPAVVESCMYTMTPDSNFVLDCHPTYSNIVIGAGFSGHVFKLGPVVGKLLSELSLGEVPSYDLSPFRMARFQALRKSAL